MSESKHTPGPLVVDFNSTVAGEPRFRVYSKATEGNVGLFYAEADADLFAAAPDMLAALKDAEERLAVMEEMTECRSDDEWVWAAQEKVSAAIAKAEGRS